MRIETALKRRDRAISNVRDLYSRAAHFGMASSAMNEAYADIIKTVCAKCPQWVRQYVDGYRRALTDKHYESELIFGGFVDGKFYSTHSKRADYYERNGIEPRDYADDGRVTDRGHYWRESIDRGEPRAFFQSVN